MEVCMPYFPPCIPIKVTPGMTFLKCTKDNPYIVDWAKRLPILFWTVDSEDTVELSKKYANNIIFEKLSAERANELAGTFMELKCEESALPKNFERKGELKPL